MLAGIFYILFRLQSEWLSAIDKIETWLYMVSEIEAWLVIFAHDA